MSIDWAEIIGKIVYVNHNSEKHVIFDIYTENAKKTYKCYYSGFFPIQIGDAVKGNAEYKNGKLFFHTHPFIIAGTDKNSIITCMEKRKGKVMGKVIRSKLELIYKKLETISKEENTNIPNLLNIYSVHYTEKNMNYNPYIKFSLICKEKDFIQICKNWYKNYILRSLYLLGLTKNEIGTCLMPIYLCENSIQLYDICLNNPYTLLSLSLDKCDQIINRCQKIIHSNDMNDLNNSNDLIIRNCAQITRDMKDFIDKNGWTCLPINKFYKLVKKYSSENSFNDCVNICLKIFNLEISYDSVYFKYMYNVEEYIGDFLYSLSKYPPIYFFTDIKYSRENLSDEQKDAVKLALNNNVSVITGAAGTGKTLIIGEIIHNLKRLGIDYKVSSFTGKAVERIREVTGEAEAFTLHMMISRKTSNDKFTHLILDEASMITTELLYDFRKKFPHDYKITFLGDINQLPPITWGNLFAAVLKNIPTISLKKNYRTLEHENNGIIINANNIIHHNMDGIDGTEDFKLMERENFNVIPGNLDTVKELISLLRNIYFSEENMVIITPFNKDVNLLNTICSDLYNSNHRKITDSRGKIWKIGDRVMFIQNNYTYNLMNGTEGRIIDLDIDHILVEFYNKNCSKTLNKKTYKFLIRDNEDLLTTENLILSYCVTVHRYQGSEMPYVIGYIPESNNRSTFLNKNLLYTLITRAKKAIWLVGDINTMERAAIISLPNKYDNLAKRLVNKK